MESRASRIWKQYKLPIMMVVSIILGVIVGLAFGEDAIKLRPIGQIFLNLMFTIVTPLVFVTIATSIGNMVDLKRLGKILVVSIAIFLTTGIISGVITLAAVKIYPPGEGVVMDPPEGEIPETSGDIGAAIVEGLTVGNFGDLFNKENMMAIILFAVIFGIALSMKGGKNSPVGKVLNNLNDILMQLINMIMYIAPIGLFAYFASMIGEYGSQIIGGYARTLILYVPLSFIYVLIFFPLYAYFSGGKEGVKRYAANAIGPIATAFATQSSIATIPANLNAAKRIGVPKDIREIIITLGSTMQMDGSVMSAIVKIAFLFGIYGQEFEGIGMYIAVILVAIFTGVAMSGVPGGGLIGEMLIVNIFNFPPESFLFIAVIGFLIDAPATMVNGGGDLVSSMMAARIIEGKDWMDKPLDEEDYEYTIDDEITI